MLDIIVNPCSRSDHGYDIWNALSPMLDEAGMDYKVSATEYHGHAAELTAAICEKQLAGGADCPRVIVVGGDGTINEVLNGLPLERKPILGYIPAGSGDDFNRVIGHGQSAETAMKKLIAPSRLRDLDAGLMTYGTARCSRRFLVSCGVGYDASICHEVNHSRMKLLFNRLHLGKLCYALIGARQAFSYQKASGTLSVDGKDPVRIENIAFISCHNLPYEGGGWEFAPGADPEDGLINLSIYAPSGRLSFVRDMLKTRSGRHAEAGGITLITCRRADLYLDTPLVAHTDGEVLGRFKEFHFQCLPSCLQLME